ncbi:hypothetical protein [Candidatus Methanoliparum sp. LAM-1]|uniref:hypothetical protein n=1 Tax=Candidatus Methanoliparum sp. LAM-1 TaxID=2874846 RepID=UPI001E2AE42D|nr:hypothetical protein [Candidatus Methanoliparum sp. LAM-1]BDC35778.1 hypothetical protein MTLP_04600 [Candidatus Methanoliparum sp. LAM-1]
MREYCLKNEPTAYNTVFVGNYASSNFALQNFTNTEPVIYNWSLEKGELEYERRRKT